MRYLRRMIVLALAALGSAAPVGAQNAPPAQTVRIKDVTTIQGVRDNPLIGYGMVVGLNGTGDRRQTVFSTQTLANIMQRMGVQIPASAVRVNNVASVFVTATLPPFPQPGMRIDVTVSSMGDAKSLEGGLLLLTPLYGANGEVYAAAQGPVLLGGYTAGGGGASLQVNHPTVGRVPAGAIVEREVGMDLAQLQQLLLVLREHDFSTASNVAAAINGALGAMVSEVVDGRTVAIALGESNRQALPELLARIENIPVTVQRSAKVVVNERTGTVVMGAEVRLGAVSILHGGLSIEIATEFQVSQPNALGRGETVVAPQTGLRTAETTAQRVELTAGATVETLVLGLQAIGATARDIVAILQAVRAAGALQAELEVI